MNDPFSKLEAAIWMAVEASPIVTALVRPGNRIKFHSGPDKALKQDTQVGDLPELVMFPVGGEINPQNRGTSSGTHSLTQRYAFIITTDQLKTSLDRSVNPVKWALLRALLRNHPGPSGWMGLPFVRLLNGSSFSDLVELPPQMGSLNRSEMAWKGVMTVEFGMVFTHAEMR